MPKRIVIIDGHPDAAPERFCHALADAYADGAKAQGHEVKRIVIAKTDIALLRSAQDWTEQPAPAPMQECQEIIRWAEHLVIIYPLWLGSMPAILKAFFEQVLRAGFAIRRGARTMWPGLLNGRSARIIVTMGMPAFVYRWYFLAHSLKSFERNILRFSGIGPIGETLIGNVEGVGASGRQKWLDRVRELGRHGR